MTKTPVPFTLQLGFIELARLRGCWLDALDLAQIWLCVYGSLEVRTSSHGGPVQCVAWTMAVLLSLLSGHIPSLGWVELGGRVAQFPSELKLTSFLRGSLGASLPGVHQDDQL
jgi:hypothetical protein